MATSNIVLLVLLIGAIFVPLITLLLVKDDDVEDWSVKDWIGFFAVFSIAWSIICAYMVCWFIWTLVFKLIDKLTLIFKKKAK